MKADRRAFLSAIVVAPFAGKAASSFAASTPTIAGRYSDFLQGFQVARLVAPEPTEHVKVTFDSMEYQGGYAWGSFNDAVKQVYPPSLFEDMVTREAPYRAFLSKRTKMP